MLKAEPGRSVLDVTMSCGFNSSQYFATLFRRQFGQTPRDYRNAGESVGSFRRR